MMKNDLIPVEGHPGLFRDPSTNAVINTNKRSAQQAREARENIIKQKQEFEDMKRDVQEIKELLQQLLER
jgi:hypothetical protein